ncbi:GH3 auxin-responsive promoter [Pisolithus orientalis]|uniref:GH3 auxin-responsive promoter n=1 Tax=Pisolithus orientalis TaxID=936130 RepID=UPI0022255E87|nr:GH3 auxin-responsive promoter [Pisolithus orientalis]KAI6003454.1 GH3 auxin-responsive promoter [Pisolithus orientalis]
MDRPPAPITSLTPELAEQLRGRALDVLSYLVKTNSATTYFKESDVLSRFRSALHLSDGSNGLLQAVDQTCSSKELFGVYHNNVALSVYEDYLPFISRFFEQPCKKSSVENLMAPGLPCFIAHSSGTSGGATKHFPKYRHPDHMSMSTSEAMKMSNPTSKSGGKNCIMYSLGHRQVVAPLNEDGNMDGQIPVCLMTSGVIRVSNNMVVERDAIYSTIKVPNCSSPLAVSFIPNYKSFLFMHALFALMEPKLETINTLFTTTCRDLCRAIHDQWGDFIHCIETGTIPDLEGIEQVKDDLQRFLKPNPDRAGELREIGRATGAPGWFRQIWPELRAILATASGPFATVIPKIRHYIGPDVSLQTLSIASSEAFLALAYDPTDLNLYKIVGSDDVIEFLPVDEPEESKYLAQTWNVELGKKYEVVLTTRDGFWRYRLGDVVDVVGFDPRDGQPLVRYIERRNMHIRIANEVTTETQLRSVIDTTSGLLGGVSEFCVCTDYRESVGRYAFFVELQGNLGKDSATAPAALHDELQKLNENYLRDSQSGKIGVPAVRVLKPGTFGDFREWKIRTNNIAAGQVKVPIVVWDEVNRAWLEERVMRDI